MTQVGVEQRRPGGQLPSWRAYTGKRVIVHALEGSYAEKRAATELRDAERAAEAIEKMLRPPGAGQHPQSPPIDVYMTDPVADLPIGLYRPEHSDNGRPPDVDTVQRRAIIRVVEPEGPGEPVVRPLVRLLVSEWFSPAAASIPLFTDGIAGVLAGRLGTDPGGKEADDVARARLAEGNIPSIFSLLTPATGPGASLVPGSGDVGPDPIATSFTGFLLRASGEEALRQFLAAYDAERRDQAAILAYQRPLGTLEELWLAELQRDVMRGSALPLFLRRLMPLVRPYRLRVVELLFYSILSVLQGFVAPLGLKYLIDTVIPGGIRPAAPICWCCSSWSSWRFISSTPS